MGIKQLSVFIENREGRICDVTEVIKNQGINIITLSLADTADYGMLRMIVSEPYQCEKSLKYDGFSAKLVDVIAVRVDQTVGSMHDFLKLLVGCGVSIEYMYTLSLHGEPVIVLKASDLLTSERVLRENGYCLLEEADLK